MSKIRRQRRDPTSMIAITIAVVADDDDDNDDDFDDDNDRDDTCSGSMSILRHYSHQL